VNKLEMIAEGGVLLAWWTALFVAAWAFVKGLPPAQSWDQVTASWPHLVMLTAFAVIVGGSTVLMAGAIKDARHEAKQTAAVRIRGPKRVP